MENNQNNELLNEINERLIRIEKNQIVGSRIRMAIFIVLLFAIIISTVIIVPQLATLAEELNATISQVQDLAEKVNDIDLNDLKEKLDVIAGLDTEKLEIMIETLETIDFEKMQDSINSIQSFIQKFSGLFG